MKPRATYRLLAFLFLLALPFSLSAQTRKPPAPEYTFKVVHAYPHDPQAFTQGLVYRDGFLYEGTGRNGRSSLRKVRLETGQVVQKHDLPQEYFGEGIAFYNNKIIQLTWLSHTGFVYDAADFHVLRQFTYQGEGWGLATNTAPANRNSS